MKIPCYLLLVASIEMLGRCDKQEKHDVDPGMADSSAARMEDLHSAESSALVIDAGAEQDSTMSGGAMLIDASRPAARKTDVARLKKCCRVFERMAQGKGQEGVGFDSLQVFCDDLVAALEQGEPASSVDWNDMAALFEDKRIPHSCRVAISVFEKR